MPASLRARPRSTLGKLNRPRLGRVFERKRLWALLDEFAALPCTWIAGPPGSGKTTLVASWLDTRCPLVLWLQLDPGDTDPATFAHFLSAAAATAAPRRRSLRLPPPTADDLRNVPAFVRHCLRRLAQSLPVPWVLVLDNAQELGTESPLMAGLSAALGELPHGARVIAISREPPPAQFARALASQQLAVIESQALRFTVDETDRLVALHQAKSTVSDAAALQSATDGWAAAMILMLAAGGARPASRMFDDGATRERVFGYFAGEVLAGMPATDAAALLRIALLPSTTAAMACAISGNAGAGALLDDLARRSLFTDRREGASGSAAPTYTFHALFGEFLRAQGALQIDGEAWRALQHHAATLLAADGRADAAIALLTQAGDGEAALQLLDAHAGGFFAQGRTSLLRQWLHALPEAARAQPAAQYWLGVCELALQPANALRALEHAHHGYTAAGDTMGSFRAAAAAADAIVFIGARLDAIGPWIAVLEAQAPAYLTRRDTEGDLRVLPGLLAAFVHCQPQHPLTPQIADRAEALLEQPLGASQRILMGSLALYLLWTGQVARLDRIMVKIDRLCATGDAAPATLLRWYGVGVLIRSLLGRSDAALRDAASALALAQSVGAPPMLCKAHLMMVLAALAARDAELARRHLIETAQHLDPASAIDTTTYEFQRAMLALLDSDWPDALRLMRAAVSSGRDSGWPLREHIAMLGQALAATETGDFDEAEAALASALAHRFYAMCRWHHWIAALIQARLADRRDQRERCLSALRHGFAVAREHGYDFGPMPFCCGDMMPRLAALALEHDIDRPFALAMVRRHALPAPAGASEHWPWPVRICTLGRFEIHLDGAMPPPPRKESRKPLDLLKLLIALGGRAVPIDRLAMLLWPDAQGDAARNSFDNALHRLRKLLGGDRHVQLRAGTVGLDSASCWTDLAALDSCYDRIDRAVRAHDSVELAAIAEQALGLYAGTFLTGEEAYPDVLVARSRVQARFIRQMAALGGGLEADGATEQAALVYRRVVEQEPIAEVIYRRLITCLLKLGRPAEAYEAYRRCRSQLSILLGLKPAPETEALVAALRADWAPDGQSLSHP